MSRSTATTSHKTANCCRCGSRNQKRDATTRFPQKPGSVQVLIRFGVRLLVLIVFAMFGSIGFGRSLAALLWMSTILGAVVAVIRREPPLDTILNHWDEAVTYAAMCMLVSGFNQAPYRSGLMRRL